MSVRFTVLALDYDGTIASDGRLDPEVRAAIADVRARGITETERCSHFPKAEEPKAPWHESALTLRCSGLRPARMYFSFMFRGGPKPLSWER